MTDHDELRDLVARLDPVPAEVPTEPVTSPGAKALLEEIMNTPITTEEAATPTPAEPAAPRSHRSWWLGAAAASVVAVVAIAAVALSGAFDNDDEPDLAGGEPPTVLDLSTGETDPSMMMCMEITPESIATSQIAFRAIVDSVEGDVVTMTVDTWYTGGDADVVTLTAPQGMEALIGGLAFEVGQPYLVTAYDGVVNYCGHTGPATPELQALFDQAFPG